MDLPTDFDYIIVGTGLTESLIAASLSITGNSVLHIDKADYYGGYLTSFRFSDFCSRLSEWASVSSPNEDLTNTGFNLATSSSPLFRHCSSRFFVASEQPNDTVGHKPLDVPQNSESFETADCRVEFPADTDITNPPPGICSNEETLEECAEVKLGEPSSPPRWYRSSLFDALRRVELDILPKVIFAESPLVSAIIRTDVTRYLEFRPVSRLLSYSAVDFPLQPNVDEGELHRNRNQPTIPNIIKIPVSRGEVFRTRLLSLTQKRMLVGFLEWCSSITNEDISALEARQDEQISIEHSSPLSEAIGYLDQPLLTFLQTCRGFDTFIALIVVNCLALSTDSLTLRQALPKFRRLIDSMNRVGPYPMLWPLFGCSEIPQSFCRIAAVFSAVYCLGRTVQSISPLVPPTSTRPGVRQRHLRVILSTGEEVSVSGLLVSANSSPTSWLLPQISRWIARSILIADASVLPTDLKPHDISMMPIPLSGRGSGINEPAFLLEIPLRNNERDPNLFLTHLTASCENCVDPESLFGSIINALYREAENSSEAGASKPQLLWSCYFSIPDLSNISSTFPHPFGSETAPAENSVLIVPGIDASLVMDSVVSGAEDIFNRAYALIQRDHPNHFPATNTGESDSSSRMATSSFLSLEANWDGVFPPRPPRPEDLILMETEEALEEDSSGIHLTHPSLEPSGHGDWSTDALESTLGESELSVPRDP